MTAGGAPLVPLQGTRALEADFQGAELVGLDPMALGVWGPRRQWGQLHRHWQPLRRGLYSWVWVGRGARTRQSPPR